MIEEMLALYQLSFEVTFDSVCALTLVLDLISTCFCEVAFDSAWTLTIITALKVPFKKIKLNEKDSPGGILPNIEWLDGRGHFCLRAKVQASMRKEKFSVIIKLHKLTAEVIDAGCHCKASSMSRCSHVIALLQALDDYVLLYGYTPPPCTSAVCQ
ncbi:hypothetical protein GE061_009043 [Apolygus lucorum]|uniref:SWIM-type domain-containing protein n=1 Tax=Apolygus lucorum TaxID=248454 RepID=A0A8S9XZF9_APOLU|nr:hypothetical protein GE061_009043 [Apolygus lucorum]